MDGSIRLLLCLVAVSAPAARAQDGDAALFESKIRPILVRNCASCHGAEKQRSGLRLDGPGGLRAGANGVAVVVPGRPEESRIVRAIRYDDGDLQMPPDKKLDDADIETIEAWVRAGAPMPEGGAAQAPTADFDLIARKRAHWAWQPLRAGGLPPVKDASLVRDDIDRFVVARLEALGLRLSAEADRATLLRRLHFALGGLPPSPDDVARFVADDSPQAFEQEVDRLLAAPAYGERFARHWLDLVAYSESRGFEYDFNLPNAWQYRDYVVRALNADLRYDEFLREHVAGDLMRQPRRRADGANESVLATGFWLMGEEGHAPVDTRADELERLATKIDVFGKAFLGLTVACARCHDHKFDAISQADYHAIAGYVQSTHYAQRRFESEADEIELRRRAHEFDRATMAEARRVAAGSLRRREKAVVVALADAVRELAAPAADGRARSALAQAIERAHDVPSSPLAVLARAARAPGIDTAEGFARFAASEQAARPADRIDDARADVACIIPLTRSSAEQALPSGFFDATTLALDHARLIIADGTRGPIAYAASSATHAVAEDPLWRARARAAADDGEVGVSWVQAGRTWRTRDHRLVTGHVRYLVRGPGRVYAAVNSHRMLSGPLHLGTALEWPDAPGWRWVEHDLSDYVGERVHFEFTPMDGEAPPLRIAVAAEVAPGSPPPPHALTRRDRLGLGEAGDLNELSAGIVRRAARALDAHGATADCGLDERIRAEVALEWFLTEGAGLLGIDLAHSTKIAVARSRLREGLNLTSHSALVLADGSGYDERLLHRGDPRSPRQVVRRRFLEAIDPTEAAPADGSGRADLARRLVAEDNPLTARVIVNRVWHWLFGRGLVATVDNFGALGEAPSHPELLDRLALDFMADGWSLKRLVRRLVLTSTWRQDSVLVAAAADLDPDNRLLHRMSPRRLEAEALRDALLAVSGRLDRRLGGPPVPIHLTPFLEGRGRPQKSGPIDGAGRRSLYLAVRRNFMVPFFSAFDFPRPATTVGRRSVSNVPAQALALMNDPFVAEQATRFAERLLAAEVATPRDRAALAIKTAFGRLAGANEIDLLVDAVGNESGGSADWTRVAHILFLAKEFSFIR